MLDDLLATGGTMIATAKFDPAVWDGIVEHCGVFVISLPSSVVEQKVNRNGVEPVSRSVNLMRVAYHASSKKPFFFPKIKKNFPEYQGALSSKACPWQDVRYLQKDTYSSNELIRYSAVNAAPIVLPSWLGPEHVVSAISKCLVRSLNKPWLNLFTGTRGVGKTTNRPIFSKSLNCELGLSATTPVAKCSTCVEIEQGKLH